MKKYLLLLITLTFVLGSNAFAATSSALNGAIAKYKTKNYVGCIQDTEDILKKDSSNVVAYYYMAISYANIGMKQEAIEAYQKVSSLASNQALVEYAEKGVACLEDPSGCMVDKSKAEDEKTPESDMDKFIRSGESVSKEIREKIQKMRLDQMKDSINKEADQTSKAPTNDEIAEAVKTLAKAGINPFQATQPQNPYIQAQQAMYQNPEYWQMQMLMGNNSNYGNNDFMSNMLPYFFSQNQANGTNTNHKMTADMFKNMMMASMMGSMNTTFDTNTNRL